MASRNASITDQAAQALGDAVKSVSDATGAAIQAVSDAVPEATPLAPSLDTTALGNSLKDAATYSSETLEASFPETAKLLNGPSGIAGTAEWKAVAQAATQQKAKHLRDQLEDAERCASLRV